MANEELIRTEPMGAGRFVGLLALCLLMPPVPVAIEYGCGHTMTIELLLWFFIPFGGFFYAIAMVIKARNQSKRLSRYPLAEEGRARPTIQGTTPPPAGKPQPQQATQHGTQQGTQQGTQEGTQEAISPADTVTTVPEKSVYTQETEVLADNRATASPLASDRPAQPEGVSATASPAYGNEQAQ